MLHSTLLVTGIIDEGQVTQAATPFNAPYRKRVIRWEKLCDYLNSPLSSIQQAYGWNTNAFQYNVLIDNVLRFGQSIGFCSSPTNPEPSTLQALHGGTDVVSEDNAGQLRILKFPLLPILDAPIGVEVYPLLNAGSSQADGLGIGLYFDPSGGLTYPLTDELTLGVKYTGTGPLDAGIVIVPGQPPKIVSNIFGGSGPQADLSQFVPEFTYANPGEKTLLFDSGFGAKMDFAFWAFRAGVSPSLSGFFVETDLKGVTLTIGGGQGDGFLQSVLPAQPMSANFDLTLGFSSATGLYFGGSVSLEVTLPTHVSIGPVTIQAITVALKPAGGNIPLNLGADVAFSLGPIAVVVQNMGAAVAVSFPPNRDGNFGPMQVDLGFKSPSGAGLSIDAAGVSGGGFLKYDDATHEYSGVLQLQFNELALQAFGLISTQVAGRLGYSLLALIDADFPPVALGWGFTLNGVGGLLALNRAASTDALHAALKANTLSSILFPKNAITNAPQILSTLDALFPTAPGRFLFGPMALIGWGTPTMLTAAIAVVVELPEPIRIILIARLTAKLPSESQALVRINMDALGVLDLSQDSLSLDATLFDSKLLAFTLSGDMALRANWGAASQREFLLAIGGVHPQFTPPAGFPALQRVTIDMPSGLISKLRLAAYLAISSNTVQFGATLDVFIGVAGFGLSGHLGFDALLALDPFHFDADISGQVALTAGGDDLMSVGLEATLSGPAPWHIAGSFKIHLLFFDVEKSFSHSWGDDAPPPQIAPVAVLPLLTAALADARNWGAALPAGTSPLVSLKDPGAQTIHPLARLEVHESVVPLGLSITHVGSAPVTGANSFAIGDYQVNASPADHETIQDDFAPAQFFDLSDEEKLARPSFERHDAGVRLTGVGLTACGTPVSKTIAYETYYVDQADGELRTDPGTPPQTFVLGELVQILAIGASARAAIHTAGDRRYTAPGTPVTIAPQRFVIADRDSMAPAGISPSGGVTYSDAAASLLAQNRATQAALQIITSHEVAAA